MSSVKTDTVKNDERYVVSKLNTQQNNTIGTEITNGFNSKPLTELVKVDWKIKIVQIVGKGSKLLTILQVSFETVAQ